MQEEAEAAGVPVVDRDREETEEEWEAHWQRGLVGFVFVRNVDIRNRTSREFPVLKCSAPSAALP